MNKGIDFQKIMSRAPRVRLGDYIEQSFKRNTTGLYGEASAVGVNIDKELRPMRGNISNKDFTSFYIVSPGYFAYNPRGSRKLGLGYNNTVDTYIITFNNVVFYIKPSSIKDLLAEYLFMFLSRKEWDRQAEYLSWGSSTEVFTWETLCDIEIPLPSIEVQREIVATYEGLKNIAEENEALLGPLQAACHAYIVDCKAKYDSVELGDLIRLDEVVNKGNLDYPFIGLNIKKEFMPTAANTDGLDKRKYKIIEKGKFVFSGMQTGRDIAIRLGLYSSDSPALITSAYSTFVVDEEKHDVILPEFIFMLFNRSESDRLGWFLSDSSVRSNLDWDRFCGIKIPLPPIEVQEAIVSIYHCMEEAKCIAREARELMKTICPALIQKAANSGGVGSREINFN